MTEAPRSTTPAQPGSPWGKERKLAIGLGIPMLLAGVAAIFLGHDGVAVTALIVLSGAMLLFGITGIFPDRVSLGKHHWARLARDQADKKAAKSGRGEIARAADQALDSASGPGEDPRSAEAMRLAAHVVFDRVILESLKLVATQLDADLNEDSQRDSWWDAEIRKGDQTVLVSSHLALDEPTADQIHAHMANVPLETPILLVLREVDVHALGKLEGSRRFAILTWDNHVDRLQRILSDLLETKELRTPETP